MLKGIPEILSPELLKVLCEMGHSDRLVIADGNFPVESMGKNAITIRCDGHGVPEILDAITYHTTGRPAMTMIEKIVYLADYIEPGRKKIPGLAEVRTAAFDDIDTAVCMTAESTLAFLKKSRKKSRSYDRKNLSVL